MWGPDRRLPGPHHYSYFGFEISLIVRFRPGSRSGAEPHPGNHQGVCQSCGPAIFRHLRSRMHSAGGLRNTASYAATATALFGTTATGDRRRSLDRRRRGCGRLRCGYGAPLCNAAKCLHLGEQRKSLAHARNDVNDPTQPLLRIGNFPSHTPSSRC